MWLTLLCCAASVAIFWVGSLALRRFRARRAAAAPQYYAQAARPWTKEDYLLVYNREIKAEAERRALLKAADDHVAALAGDIHGEFVGAMTSPPADNGSRADSVPNG